MTEYASYYHDDSELLAGLAKGDEHAFALLYDRYYQPVVQFIQQVVKSPVLAEDLAQETFINLWEARKQFANVHSLKGYVFVAARNHALNCLKRVSSEQALKGEIIRHFRALRSETEEEMLTRAYLQHFRRVLETLPPQTRQVFRLCRDQQHSYDEVAKRLGISRNAVKKHMVRSMKTLRSAAEKDLGISFGLLFLLIHRF